MRNRWFVLGAVAMAWGPWCVSHAQELWPSECPSDFISNARLDGINNARASDWPVQCFHECPVRGSQEVVSDPAMAADRCFVATTISLPDSQHAGETESQRRDIDLDGAPELLEIRGTGNRLKSIYVFREAASGYEYLGRLSAHPSFFVARDRDNKVVLLNLYRAGAGEVYLQYIEYIDNEFKVVREDRMH